MNPVRFWFAIIALLGFVVVVPGWLHFAGPAATGFYPETQWLVALFLPMAILLTMASWLQPG